MTPTSSTSPGTASFRKRPKTRSGSSHWKPMSSNTKVNRGCSASGAPNRGASSRCSTPYGKAEYASSRPTRLRSVNNSRTSKGDKHAERSDYDSKIQNRSRRGCLVGQPSEYSRGDHGTSLENRRREKEGPPQDRHHAVAHGGPGGGSGHRQPQRTSVPNLYQDGAARGSAKGAPVRLIGPAPAGAFATAATARSSPTHRPRPTATRAGSAADCPESTPSTNRYPRCCAGFPSSWPPSRSACSEWRSGKLPGRTNRGHRHRRISRLWTKSGCRRSRSLRNLPLG